MRLSEYDIGKDQMLEPTKIYCLEQNEIIELETPIVIDITQLTFGRLNVITKSIYPIGQFVDIDLMILDMRFSIVGRVDAIIRYPNNYYEICIGVDELPAGLLIGIDALTIDNEQIPE